ncbi:hypothetical protein [Halosimplex sp. TS25]|uniref:hypothetical protein n=1 Tax=Halosimplex rarum TaxID=3396619 RepID=UPI0039E93484
MAEDTTRSAFMDWICRRQFLWISLLALTLVHLVIAVMAATAIEPGSANYYVLLMDFGLIAVLLVVIGLVFWRCGYLGDTPMH